jgi:type I restriction enzyme M protein
MNAILRAMTSYGLLDQSGYRILVQCIALKIFDEKRNEKDKSTKLKYFISDDEYNYHDISDPEVQRFISRFKELYDDAESTYVNSLKNVAIKWNNDNHIRTIQEIVHSFQDYSFVRSEKSDLYQLVFYNFAHPFQKGERAQFLTPIRLIDFLVKIVNPRGSNQSICDPCVGIADFLSLAYVNSNPKLDDYNLWGIDIDENMIMLSQINMLLNGDGNAHLLHTKDKGSIQYKIRKNGDLVALQPHIHSGGNWDDWRDGTKLLKFDVILTNPPFGKGRSYEIKSQRDRDILTLYETWDIRSENNPSADKSMDLGVLFLENAVRLLNKNGRFGIVLSNSIVANDEWQQIMAWLIQRVRIVAIFDLPEKVFAETNINPTLIVAYKPESDELELLKQQNYSVFVRVIKKVGYEVITVDRNLVFKTLYKINPDTYNIEIDQKGDPVVDEEFTNIIEEFRTWTNTQEETLKKLFVG